FEPYEAPAGNLRFHQALLGPPWLPAHGPGHRKGDRPDLVLDRARASRQPREAGSSASRPHEAARDGDPREGEEGGAAVRPAAGGPRRRGFAVAGGGE